MKKKYFLLSFIAMVMIMLTACGDDNDSSTGSKDKKSKGKGFKEVESFELEFPVLNRDFALNETGDILFWGEDNKSSNRDQPSYVWVDGDMKSLDTDIYSSNAFLSPSGKIISAAKDRDKPEDEQLSIIEYDPTTDTEEEFSSKDDLDIRLFHVGPGRYLENPKTYVHTVTNTDIEGVETFLWDIEDNAVTDLAVIRKLKEDFGDEELPNYPIFTLSNDGSTVYASISSLGLFAYDVASESLENLVSEDRFLSQGGNTTMLTSDEKHFAYAVNDSDDNELVITAHAVNLDTKETIEIGEGSKIFTLTDGNIIIVNDEEVKHFDFDTEKLETIHTIDLEEDQKLNNVTVSVDGSTIAYGYTEKVEDEDDVSYMSILSNK